MWVPLPKAPGSATLTGLTTTTGRTHAESSGRYIYLSNR
ncbi:hypothetical protein D088_880095 [Salmonella enterica subsp. houtenae serovar 16:z4,z32:-- str. RKS3027]|nr:hypothetical protein D088_880095 [Salmonella enterica subsp. houtenae serovar 16:z4,z32:-- str. RKS3027]